MDYKSIRNRYTNLIALVMKLPYQAYMNVCKSFNAMKKMNRKTSFIVISVNWNHNLSRIKWWSKSMKMGKDLCTLHKMSPSYIEASPVCFIFVVKFTISITVFSLVLSLLICNYILIYFLMGLTKLEIIA